MNMNRRLFLRAAAASTAAALGASTSANAQTVNAPVQAGSSPAITKPIEVDLADPKAQAYLADGDVDAYARLEELWPGDAGQLSGACLRVSQATRYTFLQAHTAPAPQPYGGHTTHCLGYMSAEDIRRFVVETGTRANTMANLRELENDDAPLGLSGARLFFFGGDEPEMRLCFGAHCLGVLRGRLLTALLDCARIRAAEATWGD
jgi:hypothetical protein